MVNDPQDGQQIVPAMERVKQRWGSYPPQALADGAYTNLKSVLEMHEREIDYNSTWTGRNAATAGRGKQRHEDYQRDKFGFDETSNEMMSFSRLRLSSAAWKS